MTESLRVVYAGSPEFAVPALERLVAEGHEIAAVYTQPDRPAGRGRRYRSSPVKARASELGLPIEQPESLTGAEQRDMLRALEADAMIVAAYGQILPRTVLAIPRLGCLNIHASLLPRWRGAAPIQRALLAGDTETGACLMRMSPGMDTGPVIASRRTAIEAADTAGSLHDRLAALGAELLGEPLRAFARGELTPEPQSEVGVTYAPKLDKSEAEIDWREPAELIERRIRAFDPWPVAYTRLRGEGLRVWSAELTADSPAGGAEPGTVIGLDRRGLAVVTGDAVLRLLEVQPAGKRRQPAADFINGNAICQGDKLGS